MLKASLACHILDQAVSCCAEKGGRGIVDWADKKRLSVEYRVVVVSATMANWHARDICGLLLLLLVFTEAARKWAFVQDLSDVQMTLSTHDSAIHPARRLLEPQVKPGYQTQALCRTEQECEDGVGVTCMQGNVVACSCDYIAVCYPNVKKCSVYNSTHIESCGF